MPHSHRSHAPGARRGRGILMRAALTAGVLLAALPAPLVAQGLLGVQGGVELGGEYRGNWQRVSGRPLRTGADFSEWLRLPLGGQLFSPRLASYRVTFRPEFRQAFFTGAREPLTGRQLGYSISADLLSALPVALRLQAGHVGGTSSGGIGSENRFEYRTAGATASLQNRHFPLQVTLSRSSSRNDLRAAPTTPTIRTAFATQSLNASGGSSKLNVRYERLAFDDRLGTADYRAWDGAVVHLMRWGKGSRLETGLEQSEQSGSLDFSRREWFERLHLQHSAAVASGLTFRRAWVGTDARMTRLQDWSYQVAVQLGRRVSTGLGASRSATESEDGRGTVSSLAPRLGVNLSGPGGLMFTGSTSAGVEYRRRTGQGVVRMQESDEPHATPATRSFFLEQADIDTTDLVVRSASQPIVYSPGGDYLLLVLGRSVRIDIPLTSRIQIGDRLLVSYGWFTPVAETGKAFKAAYRLSLIRGGVRLEHERTLQRGRAGPAMSRGLPDNDDWSTRLAVRTGAGPVRVDAEAGHQRRVRGGVSRSEVSLGADAIWPVTARVTSSGGLHWTRSSADLERVDALAGRVTGTWTPKAGLQLIGGAEVLLWHPADAPADRFLGATIDAIWQVFSIEMIARYEYSRRSGPLTFMGQRLSTRLVRRF